MNVRRITAALAALAIVVVPITVAAPASAGVNPGLITLALDSSGKCVASASSIIGNPGSAFTVHNKDCQRTDLTYVQVIGTAGTISPSSANIQGDSSATFVLGTASGLLAVRFAISPNFFTIPVTITDTPVENPKPHDYFQQVGVPESGDCADVDPAVGHYPGYPIGGWSKSWAQWINDGTGGAVCTREIEEEVDGTIVLVD